MVRSRLTIRHTLLARREAPLRLRATADVAFKTVATANDVVGHVQRGVQPSGKTDSHTAFNRKSRISPYGL
jgi:hypothetical protein